MATLRRPQFSVLINNYNYARYLNACIDSALAQEGVDFEVVVVDDGSTDGLREIIAAYGDRIIPVLKANGGQASSFNAGYAASKGGIVCLLDADDAFLPNKLAAFAGIYADDTLEWCFDKVTTEPSSAAAGRWLRRSGIGHSCGTGWTAWCVRWRSIWPTSTKPPGTPGFQRS